MSVMIDGAEALLADRKAEVVDYRSALIWMYPNIDLLKNIVVTKIYTITQLL